MIPFVANDRLTAQLIGPQSLKPAAVPMMRTGIASLLTTLFLVGCTGGKGDDAAGTDTSGSISDSELDSDLDGFTAAEDCNDEDGTVNPGALEVCDGVDNDCDGSVDEDVTSEYFRDADGDGFGDVDSVEEACEKPSGYVPNGNDCNDALADAFPGNTEICDTIDNDCDGETDEGVTTTYYADNDVDSYGDPDAPRDACTQPAGFVTDDTDCDDTTSAAFPGNLEVCDEIDNDCDGDVDEDVTTTYYADVDSDGYGDSATTQEACALPFGYSLVAGDCDDAEATTNPDASEYCDGHDDDCDGDIDEDDALDAADWYADSDSDTFGDAATTAHQCYEPSGYVADATDCDDADADTWPGADEYCDGHDDDCDGDTDEADSLDASDWYADTDSDGYGDAATTLHQCYQPGSYVADATDCDDSYSDTYPGADEYCDSRDNDCDGDIDEDGEVVDGDTYYADVDVDSLGDADSTIIACDAPSGYVDNDYDCNDSDGSEPVVVDKTSGSYAGSGTLSSPLDAIQDGIDRANECVIVFGGTYREAIDFDGASVDVWAVEGTDYTYIDPNGTPCDGSAPEGCEPAVTFGSATGATASLRGFTVSGGTGYMTTSTTTTTCADSSASHSGDTECSVTVYEYCGGGIYIEGDDPTLSDLVVFENTLPEFEQFVAGDFSQYWLYSYGGGICAKDSAASLEDVHVYENYADQGGGVYVGTGATLTYDHSQVAQNEAGDGAGVNVDGGDLVGTNLIVAFNTADTDGGGLFTQTSGTSSLINSNVAHNISATGATRGDALYVSSGTTFTVLNTILHANSVNDVAYSAGTFASSYSDVYNADTGGTYAGTAAAGTGDITSDPLWTNVTDDSNYNNDDWSLGSGSPALDAGNPSSGYNDTDGTANDMGAHGGPGGDW